eukprot:COSAG01_NODE_1915_length_8918_cov_21.920853_7_plen_246_part_00
MRPPSIHSAQLGYRHFGRVLICVVLAERRRKHFGDAMTQKLSHREKPLGKVEVKKTKKLGKGSSVGMAYFDGAIITAALRSYGGPEYRKRPKDKSRKKAHPRKLKLILQLGAATPGDRLPPPPTAPASHPTASPVATPVASPVRPQGAAVAAATATPTVDLTGAAAATAAHPIEILSDSDEELGSDEDEADDTPVHTAKALPSGLTELQQDSVRDYHLLSLCIVVCQLRMSVRMFVCVSGPKPTG